MRVAFYAPMKPPTHPTPSGDRAIAQDLWRAFAARGHECLLLSEFRARWFYRSPAGALRAAAALAAAARRAASFRPDVFFTYHLYYKAPDPIGAPLSRAFRRPYVVYEASHAESARSRLSTAPGYHLARWALEGASAVFSNMAGDVAQLRELLPPGRLGHVPPSVDSTLFRPDPDARAAWRREHGVPQDAPLVACAAMLRPGRKLESARFLVESLSALPSRHAPWLALAGGGEGHAELAALARRALGERALLPGALPREQVARLLAAADLFAYPGLDEGFGLVYLEAQAAGLPVAALRDGGVPDAVADGEAGLLTPPGDRAAYAAALAALLDDAGLRARLGAAGRRRALERHDPARNYGAVVSRCEALAAEASA